jgi:hypothetical protein
MPKADVSAPINRADRAAQAPTDLFTYMIH